MLFRSQKDLSYDIMEERVDFAIQLMNKMKAKYKLELTDAEVMENARNIGLSLFIQKETKMRMKK